MQGYQVSALINRANNNFTEFDKLSLNYQGFGCDDQESSLGQPCMV